MKTFFETLLGGQPAIHFAALFFFALLGAVLSLLLQTTERNPKSMGTPFHFSWSFFVQDNAKRFLSGLLLILVALRFTPDLFGVELTEFYALIIGFANDKIAQFLKDKTNLFGQKK